jgi:hypothetical protein
LTGKGREELLTEYLCLRLIPFRIGVSLSVVRFMLHLPLEVKGNA